jgi:hypothetical protein
VEAIDRPAPTRAEIAFIAAVNDLAEADETESPTDDSEQRSESRHAGAQQSKDRTRAGAAKSGLNGSTKQAQGEYREQFFSE